MNQYLTHLQDALVGLQQFQLHYHLVYHIQLQYLVQIIHESQFIETEPVGETEQPPFVNGVFLIETTLSAEQLKERLRAIEEQLGRTQRIGPRTIDLDIVIWNNKVVDPDVLPGFGGKIDQP